MLAALVLAAAPQAVSHVRSLLSLDGELLAMRTADTDGDGRLDLLLALRRKDGSRWIHVHRLRADGALPAVPDRAIEVKKDVVAWGTGEFVAGEPGAELLLTTRGAAFALSTRAEGYRGIQRLGEAEMLLDLPCGRELPAWPAVADADGDGVAEVVLPTMEGFRIFSGAGGDWGELALRPAAGRRPAYDRAYKLGRATVSGQPLSDLVVPDEDPGALEPPPAVYATESLPLPWFGDADGDGLLDLIYEWQGAIHIHRQRAAGVEPRFAAAPDQVLPYEDGGDWDIYGLELVDAGGGPAVDLMVTRREAGLDLSGDWEVLLFLDPFRSPGGMSRPASIAATEAGLVVAGLADLAPVDGRLDLVVSAWNVNVSVLGGTSVDIDHQVLVYAAEPAGGHARRPALRYERRYDADDFTAFSAVPALTLDLSGDGAADLLESDPHGVLEVRPISASGGRPELAGAPVRRIEVDALNSEVLVMDLDGDTIGDLIVLRRGAVEVLVARRG